MGFRAWVGLWTAFILIVIVITDCSALVKYITRFTEESFAALIAFIFIMESVKKLLAIRKSRPFTSDPLNYYTEFNTNENCFRCLQKGANGTFETPINTSLVSLNRTECASLGAEYEYVTKCKYSPDVFFVSVFLYTLTFLLAMTLRYFRTSRFFPTFVRSKVADFGVVITILIAVGTDYALGFDTPKLIVPIKFQNTIPSRGWIINPLERNKNKPWLVAAAITAVIVNRKENKLKKSSGYHLDLLIVAITIGINSILGLVFFFFTF